MRKIIFPLLMVLGGTVVGCDTSTPNSPAQQTAMRDEAKVAVEQMEAQDPSLVGALNNSVGYVVFPDIGEAAVGIGGAHGQGFVYQNGHRVGMIKMNEGSIGPQVGGATYAELIIFRDAKAMNRMMNDSFEFGSDASAAIVKAGAAGDAQFAHGVQVYVLPKGGLYAGASLNGQKFHYTATNSNGNTNQTTSTDTNAGGTTTTTETQTTTH